MSKLDLSRSKSPKLISDFDIKQELSGVPKSNKIKWSKGVQMMKEYQNNHPKQIKIADEITGIETALHGFKVKAEHLKLIMEQDDSSIDEVGVYFAIKENHLDRTDPDNQYLTIVFIGIKDNIPFKGVAIDYCEPLP